MDDNSTARVIMKTSVNSLVRRLEKTPFFGFLEITKNLRIDDYAKGGGQGDV